MSIVWGLLFWAGLWVLFEITNVYADMNKAAAEEKEDE